MVSVNPEDLPDVIASVTRWPIHDRIKLAQRILQTVDEETSPQRLTDRKKMTADEVVALLQPPQPAPTDEECDAILEDELMKKYGS